MFVKDYENGFSCYVPDEFSEVKKENYEAWNVVPGTLHYFVVLDENGEIEKAVSLNKLAETETDEELDTLIQNIVEKYEKCGLEIVDVSDLKLTDDRTVKRVAFTSEEGDVLFVTYVAHLKKLNVCSTISVTDDYDEEEGILAIMFSSMEDL